MLRSVCNSLHIGNPTQQLLKLSKVQGNAAVLLVHTRCVFCSNNANTPKQHATLAPVFKVISRLRCACWPVRKYPTARRETKVKRCTKDYALSCDVDNVHKYANTMSTPYATYPSAAMYIKS